MKKILNLSEIINLIPDNKNNLLIILFLLLLAIIFIFLYRLLFLKKKSISQVEFSQNAVVFGGLFEPLYLISSGVTKYKPGIIGDWLVRTENLSNALQYKNEWSEKLSGFENWDLKQGVNKTKELINFIRTVGIARDTASKVTIDSKTFQKYVYENDFIPEIGKKVKVKTPFWYFNDIILEKGVIGEGD